MKIILDEKRLGKRLKRFSYEFRSLKLGVDLSFLTLTPKGKANSGIEDLGGLFRRFRKSIDSREYTHSCQKGEWDNYKGPSALKTRGFVWGFVS